MPQQTLQPTLGVQAMIFDLDGTLADTMPTHYEAWMAICDKYHLQLSEDRFYEVGGMPTKVLAEMLVRESGEPLDPMKLAREKEERFLESLHTIKPVDPAVAIARQYRGHLPMAVATGAIREVCERVLKQIGFIDCFDAIVTSEDVQAPKPAPDIFLVSAAKLGVEPARCQVYEDADPGLEAARRAGMQYVDIRKFFTPRRVTAKKS